MVFAPQQKILPKDFLQTSDDLVFAVVSPLIEDDHALCTLRYQRQADRWHKLSTEAAEQLLRKTFPQYLFHSNYFDADLHAVKLESITHHFRPTERIQEIQHSLNIGDPVLTKLNQLLELLESENIPLHSIGVTGSLLINAQKDTSDIDLVIYDREDFHDCRAVFEKLIKLGRLASLDQKDWATAYDRRGCDLTLESYIWHEERKFNKAMINGTKVDLSFVDPNETPDLDRYRKLGSTKLIASVIDDTYSYDSPAIYLLDSNEYDQLLSFTPTYSGQALQNEMVRVTAKIEENLSTGVRRLVVGSDREAKGEMLVSLACPYEQ